MLEIDSRTTSSGRRSRTGAGIGILVLLGLCGIVRATEPPDLTGIRWSTYLGGELTDRIMAAAIGPEGVIVVVGRTECADDFPITADAFCPTYCGGPRDAFVTVFDPAANTIFYSTFLGGAGLDEATDVTIDGDGIITVFGLTGSVNFPTTAGAFDTTFNGGMNDLFLARIDPSQSGASQLLYSSFLGGCDRDAVDLQSCGGRPSFSVSPSGLVTLVSTTNSSDFPTTSGAYDPTFNGARDGVLVRMDPQGNGASDLVYATFFGGYHYDHFMDLFVDESGIVTVVGATQSPDFPTTAGAFMTTIGGIRDAVLARFDPQGGGASDLLYASFLGATRAEWGLSVARLDPTGWMVVGGYTWSDDFPTTPGAFDTILNGDGSGEHMDAFVSVMDPAGGGASDLVYSTYLGGNGHDYAYVATNGAGEILATAFTSDVGVPASEFPVTLGAADTSFNALQDAYLTRLRPDGSGSDDLVYSTLLGGSGDDVGLSILPMGEDEVLLMGATGSPDFPATGYQTSFGGIWDGFLMRIDLRAHPCGLGNVDASKAPVSDVLLVNGSSWAQSGRVLTVSPAQSFTIEMLEPPSTPGGPSGLALYGWAASPSATPYDQPSWLGRTCLPTPLNLGVLPQPFKIANSIGKPGRLGEEDWPGPPTSPAPCTLLDLPAGLGHTGTFYLQGFIVDSAAPNGLAAVTNGIQVISQ